MPYHPNRPLTSLFSIHMAALMALTISEISLIEGKNIGGVATKSDVEKLIQHIRELEALLDSTNDEDFFGTEGWRRYAGIDN